MADHVHARFGDYRILQQIGAGGMGEVFLAENVHHHKQYAIKILPEELGRDVNFRKRFFDEARVMSELDHPRIVRVHHIGECEGTYYLVMDYVTGPQGQPRSLHDELRLQPEGRINPEEALRWSVQIAEGLAYAHKRGVIHRDIKPANILITPDRNVKITDFGLVKAIGSEFILHQIHQTLPAPAPLGRSRSADRDYSPGQVQDSLDLAQTMEGSPQRRKSGSTSLLGTYDYMSPELLEGRNATVQSDIYSFGVLAYRISTGRRPVGMTKPPSSIVRGFPKRWDVIVAKCLADNVGDRYSSVEGLLKDLTRADKRHRVRTALLFLVVLASVAAASFFAWRTYLQPSTWNPQAWENWCSAISWIRPLQQAGVRREADWRTDGQLTAVLRQMRVCCAPFEKSPDLERCYKASAGAGAEQLKKALAKCESLVTANREAVLAINRVDGTPALVESFFRNPSAANYWPRLNQLKRDRDALRVAGCSAMCDFLDRVVGKFESPDRMGLAEGVGQVLDLTSGWPGVEYDALDRASVAVDPDMAQDVRDIPDFLSRLARLQSHAKLSQDQSQKIDDAAQAFKAARQRMVETQNLASLQGIGDAKDLEAVLDLVDPDIARAEALPRTVDNCERIVATYDAACKSITTQWYLKSLEWGLHYCYAPKEELSWLAGSEVLMFGDFYNSWRKWQGAQGVEGGETIGARLERLRKIETMRTKSDLVDETTRPDAQVEAILCAWRQLGSLPDGQWPQTPKDWDNEQLIQEILWDGLKSRAAGEPRFESLRKEIADANLVREVTFRKAVIGNYIAAIRDNGQRERFLNRLIHQDWSELKDVVEARSWERAVSGLPGFVAKPDWSSRYDTEKFYQEKQKGREFLIKSELVPQDIEGWRQALAGYPNEPVPIPPVSNPTTPGSSQIDHGPSLAVEIPDPNGGAPFKLELKRIEAKGKWFKMGVPPEKGRLGGPLERQRCLARDFYIGKYEITQAQYWAVMHGGPDSRPSKHSSDPNRPVESVSWLKASLFCERLSQMKPGYHFRLPTETEWEYACRAQPGKASQNGFWPPYLEYCSGDGDRALAKVGWYKDLGAGMAGQTKPVGQYEANGWGLHDMHGNVWEWCSEEYTADAGENDAAAKRVIRGGAYDSRAEECCSAWRDGRPQDGSFGNVGFRVVMDVQ